MTTAYQRPNGETVTVKILAEKRGVRTYVEGRSRYFRSYPRLAFPHEVRGALEAAKAQVETGAYDEGVDAPLIWTD